MTRVKTGIIRRKKHKKVRAQAKGYWMSRHRQIKRAKEAVLHAGEYAFHGRKLKKRHFRKLWILRLNAALRERGMTYSKCIRLLRKENIQLDRKILALIATEHPKLFDQIVLELKKTA